MPDKSQHVKSIRNEKRVMIYVRYIVHLVRYGVEVILKYLNLKYLGGKYSTQLETEVLES